MSYTRSTCPNCGEPTFSDINGGECGGCQLRSVIGGIVATLDRIAEAAKAGRLS